MPFSTWSNDAANVLMFALQDHIADTVVPRLVAANAETSNVHLFSAGGLHQFSDPRLLEVLIDKYEASLVIVDPAPSDLCRKQANTRLNADTAIGALARVAEITGAAVLIVHAVPEPAESSPRTAMARSLKMASAARSVLHIAIETESDSEYRLLSAVKGNLSPRPQGLRFRVKSEYSKSQPALDWVELVDSSEDRSDSTPSASAALKHAQEFLRGALANGGIESHVLRETAREHGISLRTLERARNKIAKAVRVNGLGADGKWMVELIEMKGKTRAT